MKQVYLLCNTVLMDTYIDDEQDIDVSNLPNGVYLVKIKNALISLDITKQLVKINSLLCKIKDLI